MDRYDPFRDVKFLERESYQSLEHQVNGLVTLYIASSELPRNGEGMGSINLNTLLGDILDFMMQTNVRPN